MALATDKERMELADRLTESAQAIHARIRQALQKEQVDQATAQRLFQDEVVLRQRANALCLESASCVIADLKQPQESVLALVEAANNRLEKSETFAECLDLIADLLVLAGTACAAKASPFVAALQEVKKDLEGMD